MTDDIERLSRELVDRLTTEQARPNTTPGTHLVGGVVKSCLKLEQLLKALVVAAAEADGVDPNLFLVLRARDGKAPRLSRATAGHLWHSLKARARDRSMRPLPRHWKPLLRDLTARHSRIMEFVALRNEIAHEGGEPRNAEAAMTAVLKLVIEFRRVAGWE